MMFEQDWVTTHEIPITTYWVRIRRSTLRRLSVDRVKNALMVHRTYVSANPSKEEKRVSHFLLDLPHHDGFVVVTHSHSTYATVLLNGEKESNRVRLVAIPDVHRPKPNDRLSFKYYQRTTKALTTLSAVNKR